MAKNKFFIAGSDYFSVAGRGNAIIQSLSDFDVEVIEGNGVKIAEVLEELQRVHSALRTVSMFSAQKFVWYKNVTFLGDDALFKSDDVQAWLQNIQQTLAQLPEVGFLLTATTIDRRLKIIKWFLENCQSEIFDEPKKIGCEQHVLSRIRSAGKAIKPDGLQQFLQCTGNNLGVIDSELDKLLLYVHGKNEIAREDVEAIGVDLRNDDFFETVDLFFGDSPEQFFSSIRRYFLFQGEGRPLLAALQNRTRLLIQLRHFYENDGVEKISKPVLEQLKDRYAAIYRVESGSIFAQNPWYLGKLLEIAKKCSLENWMQLHIALLHAIIALAEHHSHQQTVFEQLYFHKKLFSSTQKAKDGVA
ncbi:MAG: DNA polymerase III subunit delta [Puniceicoccales bacterium]|jgi:DNA polymerase-3 subunit delta|nr:DNA polymerase III subunit delta [Puniceicoccales bacterium]